MKSGLNKGMYHQGIQQPPSGLKAGIRGFNSISFKKNKRRFKDAVVSLSGSRGMQLLFSGDADDANISVGDIGFEFIFYGNNYRDNIFVGSNSYITFGLGSNQYAGFSPTSSVKGIFINSADRSYQQVFVHDDDKRESFTIRFEGSVSTSGTPGNSNFIWEVTLFNEGVIQLVVGENIGQTINFLASGQSSRYLEFPLINNTSVVFFPVGENYTYLIGSYG